MMGLKDAAMKAVIVLAPSYTAAFLTEKMVYVVPTLAAAGFFASSISLDDRATVRRVDDEGTDGADGPDGEAATFPADDA